MSHKLSADLKLVSCSCEEKSPLEEVHRILGSSDWANKLGVRGLPLSPNQQQHLETLSTSGFYWACTDRPSGTGDGPRVAAPCWILTAELTQPWIPMDCAGNAEQDTWVGAWMVRSFPSSVVIAREEQQGGPNAVHSLLKISVLGGKEKLQREKKIAVLREKGKNPNNNYR